MRAQAEVPSARRTDTRPTRRRGFSNGVAARAPTFKGTPRTQRPGPAWEAPRRRRVHRGAPRRRPDPGAAGRSRPPRRLPLRGSSRRPPGCRRTSTSSCAASSGPSSSCKAAATCPWRMSPRASASPIRASSPTTSSASSASRRDNSAGPQESHKSPQTAPRTRAASPLPFSQDRGGWRPSFAGGEDRLPRAWNGVAQSPGWPGTRRSRGWLRSRNCPPRGRCRGIGAAYFVVRLERSP
jgi:hypothetical protein